MKSEFRVDTLDMSTYLESLEMMNQEFIVEKTNHMNKKETIIPLEMLDGNCCIKEVCSESLKKSLKSNGDDEDSMVFLVGDQGVVRDFLCPVKDSGRLYQNLYYYSEHGTLLTPQV
jgi:hypothetical protein